jgi:hypothetical protein
MPKEASVSASTEGAAHLPGYVTVQLAEPQVQVAPLLQLNPHVPADASVQVAVQRAPSTHEAMTPGASLSTQSTPLRHTTDELGPTVKVHFAPSVQVSSAESAAVSSQVALLRQVAMAERATVNLQLEPSEQLRVVLSAALPTQMLVLRQFTDVSGPLANRQVD